MKNKIILLFVSLIFSNQSFPQTISNVKLLAVSPIIKEPGAVITVVLDSYVQCDSALTDRIRVANSSYGDLAIALHTALVDAAQNELIVAINEDNLSYSGSLGKCSLLLVPSGSPYQSPLNIYYQ